MKKALASVTSWLPRQNISEQGFSMDHITELFCILDDFCKIFNESLEKALISEQKTKLKKSALSRSEAMTIVILFHKSGFRFFKYFYCQMIVPFWKSAFPKLPGYNRFIEIMPRCLQALVMLRISIIMLFDGLKDSKFLQLGLG